MTNVYDEFKDILGNHVDLMGLDDHSFKMIWLGFLLGRQGEVRSGVEQFSDRYKKLIDLIQGDKENVLMLDQYSGKWRFEAVGKGNVPIPEVCGEICVEADNLVQLVLDIEDAIVQYNKGVTSETFS